MASKPLTAHPRLANLLTTANLVAVSTLLVGVLLWLSGSFSFLTDNDRYPWMAKLTLLLAAFVLQLLAQRRPNLAVGGMCALLAVDLVRGPSLPVWISLSDVLYLAVVGGSYRLRRMVILLAAGLTVALVVAGAAVQGAKLGVLVGLVGVALLLSPIGYAQSVLTTRQAAADKAAAAVATAHAERSAVLADERRRLSRELHDTVAGHVSAIAILSEAARAAADPAPIVESIRGNSLAALTELRAMIDLLADDADEVATVRWSSLGPLMSAAAAVGSPVTLDGDPTALPHHLEAVATRIAGEAIANATKHAPGRPISVAVAVTDGQVWLRVSNAADTAAPAPTPGRGLANMAIRAESVGGDLATEHHDGWWRVLARLPLVSSHSVE